MRRVLVVPLILAALVGAALGFAVARDLSPNEVPETVSIIEVPSTPTPTPEPTPSPTPTSDVQISDGRGNDGCPSGCDCQRTGSGVIIRCSGG
jgi:hypothetical protein